MEEAFAACAEGLADLQGAWFPGSGEERAVEVSARDREALLVAWLNELLFLQETEDLVFGGFAVDHVSDERLGGLIRLEPRGDRRLEAVGVKAATYHRVRVAPEDEGWVAEAYLDV